MLSLLVALAVAAFAAALGAHAFGVLAPAAAVHLAFAAGVMPLILGAIQHFVPVLSRTGAPSAPVRLLPLAAVAAGWLAVAGLAAPARALAAGAALGALAALAVLAWVHTRARRALGRPHPGLHWYALALACLFLALAAVLAIELVPEQRAALLRFHLHLNTLGFVALAAVGTLQVLLPTSAGRGDAAAARRLATDLPWAALGALFTALGAGWWPALAWAGVLAWGVPVTRLLAAWVEGYGGEVFALHRAGASFGAATFALLLLLLAGGLHAAGAMDAARAVPAFLLGFLLPLVTGAASQLLPVWIRPGVHTSWHEHVRRGLARLSGLRALLFLAAGTAAALGHPAAYPVAALGLALFIAQALYTLAGAAHAATGPKRPAPRHKRKP